MLITYKNRKIDINLANVTHDYDYWCDAYIESAYYEDTLEDLTEDELEDLQENGDMDLYIMDWLH